VLASRHAKSKELGFSSAGNSDTASQDPEIMSGLQRLKVPSLRVPDVEAK
jgi:hypothetical protein